ncbi:MAG: DMT family transporter [Bacteroidota bacterium]|nr:DMT family transporter [Bacteroidota bacterium]MDP3145582.1 DMT family transporter [Bacteroidota bacterium]
MFKDINKHYLLLHIIVFIWGFSPVLGRFINTDAYQLVWFRILITVAVMFMYLKFTKQSLKVSTKHFWQLSGIGVIIMVHWLAFYGAIKVSNISVTMVAFSTGTLFSSIIEPIIFKRKVRFYEVIIGLIIMGGIALIFSIETEYWLGILLGVFAAFTSSLFSVFNSIIAHQLRSGVISFYELSAALLSLTIFLALNGNFKTEFFVVDNSSIIGLLLLSLVCTVFPFIASVNLSKYISPYTIVLTVNLETVYGIIWAILFYNENKELKPTFYVGVLIILLAIFLNSYLKSFKEKKLAKN